MKEIIVISGKGGTGKTSVTASFAVLGAADIVAADCDVDAADMHLLLKPDFAEVEDFYSGEQAVIDADACASCGKCADVCRFDAVRVAGHRYSVDPLRCEGCGYCARVCPAAAIRNQSVKAGVCYVSKTRAGFTMVHAKLGAGSENSGKLVAHVKNKAKALAEAEGKKYVLVDGSPGLGCPVVSSLSGAHFVVFVTEPTVSGLHDLKRVYQLVKKFSIPSGCIVNKANINHEVSNDIVAFLEEEGIALLGRLPYDENFSRAMVHQLTVVEYDEGELQQILTKAWQRVRKLADHPIH